MNEKLYVESRRIAKLLAAVIAGVADDEQKKQLSMWLDEDSANATFFKQITDSNHVEQREKIRESIQLDAEWRSFQHKYRKRNRMRIVGWAACIVILLLPLSLPLLRRQPAPIPKTVEHQIAQVTATDKPVLILSDGQAIELDGQATLRKEENAQVRISDSTLNYQARNQAQQVAWNTLKIPAATTYTIHLSDGSTVVLNARSSLKYPTAFNNGTRYVYLTGEAYFKVAHDSSRPFIVVTNQTKIKVLGTEFNVSAYGDEPEATSLVEGAVALTTPRQSVRLLPGQCAQTDLSGSVTVGPADMETALAWMSNRFVFRNLSLGEIMHETAKWYGFNYEFLDGDLTQIRFTGFVNRNQPFENVARIIESTNRVQFIITDNRILIQKKMGGAAYDMMPEN